VITADAVWGKIAGRSPPARSVLIVDVRKFLDKLDNSHAKVLSDLFVVDPCSDDTARALEAWVAQEVIASNLTKLQAADYLRLIFDAIKEFGQQGVVLPQTHLADADRPVPSPFALRSIDKERRVDRWRDLLYLWMSGVRTNQISKEWVAAIALSAVIHGALLDSTRVTQLIERLLANEPPIIGSGKSYYLFNLPFQGMGNHHLQRWFIDPVSEMLIWQFLKHFKKPVVVKADRAVLDFLTFPNEVHIEPDGLKDVIESASTWWKQRASHIDLHCASRKVMSHAINVPCWARIQGYVRPADVLNMRPVASDNEEDVHDTTYEDVLMLTPWLDEAIQAMQIPQNMSLSTVINDLLARESSNEIALIYLGWLEKMLGGFSSSKDSLSVSTISSRFAETTPRLLGLMGDINPTALTTLELEDYYGELLIEQDPVVPKNIIAAGIRDFHAYLHRYYGKPLMKDEAEVLGEEHSLKPVDANILSFDEYYRTQEWLGSHRMDDKDRIACKIVLMMAFKMGLRRMEIFGLLRNDIHQSRYPSCLVRRNALRRIKTLNSKRVIPMLAFLSRDERTLLESWQATLDEQPTGVGDTLGKSDFLFPQFAEDSSETWVRKINDKVIQALRAVTGDKTIFLHHLRHSFGTWTYLRLRAPDLPDITRHFEKSPATVFALKTGRRLRVLLFGRDTQVSRIYAFAVARLLGHSSPGVSFAHYIHCADLVLDCIVKRECRRLPKYVYLAASGVQKSVVYKYLGESIDDLVITSRNFHMPELVKSLEHPAVKLPKGRPKLPPAHQRTNWIALDLVGLVLSLSIKDHVLVTDISKELKLKEEVVTRILTNATAMGKTIGVPCDSDGHLTKIPFAVHRKFGRQYCDLLEKRLAALSMSAPALYAKGLNLYLSHFDFQKKDVVFRGRQDAEELKLLLKFLAALGSAPNEFTWVTRVLDTTSKKIPTWARQMKLAWVPSHCKAIKPKSEAGAGSYAKWLGVLPIDPTQRSIGLPVANTIFLASLFA